MKRIKFMLLAIAMLLAAPALFTSCQEDAPEINYTINVSVINDFTKVVEAINNGSLKNEQAIQKLTEAIDKMNADQQTRLQAIIDVLNSVNSTLDTKLAAIEAAMKAQTLTLESKLALLETAISNQTLKQEEMADKLITAIDNLKGSMDEKMEAINAAINNVNTALQTKLAAIEAAIKGMPNYSDKFDAVVAALGEMKTQIEALGTGQTGIATQIAGVTSAINALVDQVKDGDTDAAAALAQIIQKLEDLKGSIGGGGTTPSTMEYVDLGLPSGLKWAKCNLGASKPSDYGDYYAWGETAPKADFTWDTYKWMQAGHSHWRYITKYTFADGQTGGIWYDSAGAFIGDNKTVLDAADDAATANLGSPWRMPTKVEIAELITKCTWTWTTQDGVEGCQVDGPNGNAIFLPATGHYEESGLIYAGTRGNYWSSSLDSADCTTARGDDFFSGGGASGKYYRYYGLAVRPVRP